MANVCVVKPSLKKPHSKALGSEHTCSVLQRQASQAINNGLCPCPMDGAEGVSVPSVVASSARARASSLLPYVTGPLL